MNTEVIIGNEVVTLSQKYQPSISVITRTKLVLVGNALPRIRATEIAPFAEQLLFLRFIKFRLNRIQILFMNLKMRLISLLQRMLCIW